MICNGFSGSKEPGVHIIYPKIPKDLRRATASRRQSAMCNVSGTSATNIRSSSLGRRALACAFPVSHSLLKSQSTMAAVVVSQIRLPARLRYS